MKPNWRDAPVDWAVSASQVAYDEACRVMETRAAAIAAGDATELVWLLEHPPLYTAGTSARAEDLKDPDRFPVYKSPRGGEFTYHGPGQRVAYVMLDLSRRAKDVRGFVRDLEGWVIDALNRLGVSGERREGRVGVWTVTADGREEKIAALGVRIRRWVSFHGISLNVDPDLEHYNGIVPCGISDYGVTSLAALGKPASMAEVDAALRASFQARFGPTRPAPAPQLT
ncbi:MAG: lipoyl(octanoyl) transferase LipB [Parvularculaceae bacterium]